MTDKLFAKLWQDALDQPNKELYIAEYGYPEWFDEISEDVDEIVKILGNIHDVAHMTIRDMIEFSGLTQAGLALKFCMPIRTVENWCTKSNNHRNCPDYRRLMVARILGILEV